ncbi:MAG: hypothetical protein ACT4N2_15545 [Hyphomicrobium sp.]
MRTPILAATVVLLTAGTALAAPGKHGRWQQGYGVSPYERVQIANARANLAGIKARAWRDGKVTFFERFQIRTAENRLARLIQRSRRS